jgi:CheY-specific phosphatase CheX
MSDPCGVELRANAENTGAVLTEAVREILERMFFLAVEDVDAAPDGAAVENALAFEIEFHGAHHGRLRLVVPDSCARALAASFMGVPEPNSMVCGQVFEVMLELTNMMCGTTLSRLAPQEVFDLDPPVLLAPDVAKMAAVRAAADPGVLARHLRSGDDWIDVYWRWEEVL